MYQNKQLLVIAEMGKQKYNRSKMQSVGISDYFLVNNDENFEGNIKNLKPIKEMKTGRVSCYLIGTKDFQDKIIEIASKRGLKWNFIVDIKDEDDILKKENLEFPKEAKQKSKSSGNKLKRNEMASQLNDLSSPELSKEDAAAVLLAAEELEGMKIFPDTEENVYKAFLKIVEMYISDKDTAKFAADYYLTNKIKVS